MVFSATWKGLNIESPANYRICVQGRLDRNWFGRLGGRFISASIPAEKPPMTILGGNLSDQAALSGVLNTLYDLRLPLLAVECLDRLETE